MAILLNLNLNLDASVVIWQMSFGIKLRIWFRNHYYWKAVVSRGRAKDSACRHHVSMYLLSSAISCPASIPPGRLSTAWLVCIVIVYCRMVSK